jgi:hypothetical protein
MIRNFVEYYDFMCIYISGVCVTYETGFGFDERIY